MLALAVCWLGWPASQCQVHGYRISLLCRVKDAQIADGKFHCLPVGQLWLMISWDTQNWHYFFALRTYLSTVISSHLEDEHPELLKSLTSSPQDSCYNSLLKWLHSFNFDGLFHFLKQGSPKVFWSHSF